MLPSSAILVGTAPGSLRMHAPHKTTIRLCAREADSNFFAHAAFATCYYVCHSCFLNNLTTANTDTNTIKFDCAEKEGQGRDLAGFRDFNFLFRSIHTYSSTYSLFGFTFLLFFLSPP